MIDTMSADGIIWLSPMIGEPDSNKERKLTMKKLITLLLAAAMLLSMTACGGTAKSEATNATTPTEEVAPPTETTEEQADSLPNSGFSSVSDIDIALQEAQAPRLSWSDNNTYTLVLTGLGFNEVNFNSYIGNSSFDLYDMEGNKVSSPVYAATIHSMQFVDDKVRVELDWYDSEYKYNDEGWVLYCTKADGMADISGLNIEDYDGRVALNADSEIWQQRADFVQMTEYIYNKGLEAWGQVYAYYYPQSGNLYNLVRTFDCMPERITLPKVMAFTDTDREELLDGVDLEFVDGYPIATSEFAIICDDQATTYKYRVGMSLAAWAASELNTDGWILGPDNMLFSPDHQYWLGCSDFSLEMHGYDDVEGDGNFFIGIRSTAEHRNALEQSLEADTAAAYLVDWQTALLPTNFAVVGNQTEEVVYGMYDMAYGLNGAETLNLYMRNVHPSLLADVKVYAVKDNPEMQIPEDALVLSFVEAEVSEQDARFGQTMAVATCDMAAGANAFAITYQGKLVYWIKLGQ